MILKNIKYFILPFAFFLAEKSLAASVRGPGCAGKVDAHYSQASLYKFSSRKFSSGKFSGGQAFLNVGPAKSYACLNLGIAGSQVSQKYTFDSETTEKTNLTQTQVGFYLGGEIDLWQFFKFGQKFFITPIVGAEAQYGFAINRASPEVVEKVLTTNQNGTYYSYGAKLGLRVQVYNNFGLYLGALQGLHLNTFSTKSFSYQFLSYDVGMNYKLGK